jgi:hypothetical protein
MAKPKVTFSDMVYSLMLDLRPPPEFRGKDESLARKKVLEAIKELNELRSVAGSSSTGASAAAAAAPAPVSSSSSSAEAVAQAPGQKRIRAQDDDGGREPEHSSEVVETEEDVEEEVTNRGEVQ